MGYKIEAGEGRLQVTFDSSPSDNPLTSELMNVLRLVAQGLPNKAIAAQLQLSPGTVHTDVTNIMTALDIQPFKEGGDRTKLGILHEVLRRGIVHPRDMLPDNYNENIAPYRQALTQTEFQVLCEAVAGSVAEGRNERRPQTVKNHLGSAYKKLGVGSLEGAFGIVLNAHLGGIDLTKANGERFGEYELVDNFVVLESMVEEQKQKPEYVVLPTGEGLGKALNILGQGGIAVVAYTDNGSRQIQEDAFTEGKGEIGVIAAFDAKDASYLVLAAKVPVWVQTLLDGVESWTTVYKLLKNMGSSGYWHIHILHGNDLQKEQIPVLRELIRRVKMQGDIDIPKNVWRLLPTARRVQQAS